MKRTFGVLCLGLLLWTATPQASTNLNTTTCPGSGCVVFDVTGVGTVGVQVTGTFVGTLQFEQTIDGSTYTTWAVLPNGLTSTVTSTTDVGLWAGATTNQKVRVRFSTYTSGTAVVSVVTTQAKLVPPSAGGSGVANELTGQVLVNGSYGSPGQVLTSQGLDNTTWSDVSGLGLPAGNVGTLQYNIGSGGFGSAAQWKYAGGNALVSTATGTWFYNAPVETSAGNFEMVVGTASNNVPPGDTRPDHVAAIGWNPGGNGSTVLPNGTAVGFSSLVFESYCSFGTGCLGGDGGQSETYFNMSDGKGSVIRPLGFFQHKFQNDVNHDLSVIARADTWGFFDADQTKLIMSVTAAHGVQDAQVTLNGLLVGNAPGGVNTDWLYQNGQSLIRSDVVGVAVAPTASVLLGGTGETTVTVRGNHFALASTDIEGTGGAAPRIRLGAASATNYPKLGASGTDDVILDTAGSSANIQLTLQSKGSGSLYLNPGGTLRINGGVGVTASGSSCVITQITKGIITGATCTP